MMTTKRILFAVLCVLLILVILMTGIVINRIRALFAATPSLPDPTGTGSTSSDPSGTGSGSSGPTGNTGEPPPDPPASSEPTGPVHTHTYELTQEQLATCDGFGFRTYTCTECGKIDTPLEEMTEPLGHTFGYGEVIAATCTTEGCTRFTCTRCGYQDDRDKTAPLGHSWDAGTLVEATCTENAHTLHLCTAEGCEETKQEDILEDSALGHDFQPTGDFVPPTDTEPGYIPCTCSRCGEEGRQDISDDLNETSRETAEVTDENGEAYAEYQIRVGTQENPALFTYTIRNYLPETALTISYDPAQGLIVSYIDELGDPQMYLLERFQDGLLTLTAEEAPTPDENPDEGNVEQIPPSEDGLDAAS